MNEKIVIALPDTHPEGYESPMAVLIFSEAIAKLIDTALSFIKEVEEGIGRKIWVSSIVQELAVFDECSLEESLQQKVLESDGGLVVEKFSATAKAPIPWTSAHLDIFHPEENVKSNGHAVWLVVEKGHFMYRAYVKVLSDYAQEAWRKLQCQER